MFLAGNVAWPDRKIHLETSPHLLVLILRQRASHFWLCNSLASHRSARLQSLVMLFAFSALCALTLLTPCVHAAARFRHGLQQLEQGLDKRQLVPPSIPSIVTLAVQTPSSTATSSSTVYSYYYPSPSALPTPITQQSQVETTYIPRITTCKGPPVAFEILQQTTLPFHNYTSTIYGQGPITCDTLYYTETTTICATTLPGIASRITISECTQDVTFSSDFATTIVTPRSTVTASDGHLSTITNAPSIQLRTTYYMAPWQSLTANVGVLPADVDVKVCHPRPGNDTIEDCIRAEESWAVLPVTLTSTYTSFVDLLATLTEGPGEYVVGTVHGQFVGNKTIVSLSTEMVMNYAYEAETISRGPRIDPFATDASSSGTPSNALALATATSSNTTPLPTIHLKSTTTRTRTVQLASSSAIGEMEPTIRTDFSTETVYIGTSTVYMDDDLLFTTLPTAVMLFAESLTSSTQESTLAVFVSLETSATPVAAPSNLLFDGLTTTTTTILDNFSPLLMPGILSTSVEASVGEFTQSPVAWFQSSIAEPSLSSQWIPEFAPVTQSPSAPTSLILVPSPLYFQQSSAALFEKIQPSATQPLSTILQGVPSATTATPSPVSIKWLNTTMPGRR